MCTKHHSGSVNQSVRGVCLFVCLFVRSVSQSVGQAVSQTNKQIDKGGGGGEWVQLTFSTYSWLLKTTRITQVHYTEKYFCLHLQSWHAAKRNFTVQPKNHNSADVIVDKLHLVLFGLYSTAACVSNFITKLTLFTMYKYSYYEYLYISLV